MFTPDALISTAGGRCNEASARASSDVPRTRLSRIRRLRSAVQRPAPTFSPARCTTASTPSSAPGSSWPASGSQGISSAAGARGPAPARPAGAPDGLRCPGRPPARRPIRPEAPVMATERRAPAPMRSLPAQVPGDLPVAEGEGARQAIPHEGRSEASRRARPAGSCVGDAVFQPGRLGAVGLHPVDVLPSGEGTLDLPIAELVRPPGSRGARDPSEAAPDPASSGATRGRRPGRRLRAKAPRPGAQGGVSRSKAPGPRVPGEDRRAGNGRRERATRSRDGFAGGHGSGTLAAVAAPVEPLSG